MDVLAASFPFFIFEKKSFFLNSDIEDINHIQFVVAFNKWLMLTLETFNIYIWSVAYT